MCKLSNCTRYYDPVYDDYLRIDCEHCKLSLDDHIPSGQLHKIQFICDKETLVEPFMRVCYRYRNWYGDNDEFIFLSEEDSHYDFMKLSMDSKDIHQPVVYEVTGCYEGLSENGNPLWIILGDIRFIRALSHKNMEVFHRRCNYHKDGGCNDCGVCKEHTSKNHLVMVEEDDEPVEEEWAPCISPCREVLNNIEVLICEGCPFDKDPLNPIGGV